MAVYQYAPIDTTRSAATIAQAMQRQGDIEAQRQQALGQIWGGTLQNLGQTIGAIPQQIQSQKLQALQQQDIASQIAERQAIAKQREAQVQAAARDQQAQAMWADALKSNINPETNEPDYDKAAKVVAQQFPVQANTFLEGVQRTQATRNTLIESQQKIAAEQQRAKKALADHMGELGAVGLEKLQTDTPQNARDHFLGLVASAAATGMISEKDAHDALTQTAGAGPDQLAAIYQHYLDQAPDVKSRIVSENLKKAETAKDLAAAKKDLAPPEKGITEAQMDARAQELLTKRISGSPLTAAETAELQAYQQRKTTVADVTAQHADQRQQNAEAFKKQEDGRAFIAKEVEKPFLDSKEKADLLRDVVHSAQGGNVTAAALQNLVATLGLTSAEGVKRINAVELGQVAGAGTLWDRVKSQAGKLVAGQPVDAKVQQGILDLADLLEKSAYTKYSEAHDKATKRYGLTDEPKLPSPAPAPTGGTVRMKAPTGQVKDVPSDQVEHYKSLGATVVP